MRAKSLLDPFLEGDSIVVTDRMRLDLKDKEGIITEYLGGGYYKVFIPDWPPCFMDPGDSETDWLLYETEIELVK
jgi:hypothetical protein